MPGDPAIAELEAGRLSTGTTVSQNLTAAAIAASIAGKTINTWAYNNGLVAPTIRAKAGDRLRVALRNNLPDPTSIHWHGLALRNDQDGVPHLIQDAVAAKADYSYEFRIAHPGTYWYHSHVEMQRERGLYGALIIDDPAEKLATTTIGS